MTVADPFAATGSALRRWLEDHAEPLILGISGAQGSGKSTLAARLAEHLTAEGQRVAVLSLDDLYLSRMRRRDLADTVHPLFAVRGPPGTHDVALGLRLLDALKAGESVRLPRFDKAEDAPCPADAWIDVGTVDVVIFEGWCLGARPQSLDDLDRPVNELEAAEDADGVWRRAINARLSGPYAELFSRLDRLVFLAAPSFEVVRTWRTQQERDLRRRLDVEGRVGAHVMTDEQIARFIQHYERLTRHMLNDLPGRVDLTLPLDRERRLDPRGAGG